MSLPTLTVTPGSGTTINTLPPGGQAAPGSSIPHTLDTSVETAPGTAGTLAITVQGNTAGIPVPMIDAYLAPVTSSWTTATTANTAQTVTTNGYDTVIVTLVANSSVTGGTVIFEVYDGATWLPVKAPTVVDYTTVGSVTLSASYSKGFQVPVAGFPQFRIRLSSVLTGAGGTLLVTNIVSSAPDTSLVTVGLDPAQPLPAGTNTLGAVTQASGPWSMNLTQVGGVVLGSPSNYGTSPGAVEALPVNAYVTNTVATTLSAGTSSIGSVVFTGTVGSDYSANKPTLPNVGAAFGSSGPFANYVLVATVPASATRNNVDIENISGAQIAVVRDDGTATSGNAPTNASVFSLGAGTSSSGSQGGSWSSQTFKGRLQIYAPSSSAIVTVMVD